MEQPLSLYVTVKPGPKHPQATLSPVDYEAARDANWRGHAYAGAFAADEFGTVERLMTSDMLVSYAMPVFSLRFRDVISMAFPEAIDFYSVDLLIGGRNVEGERFFTAVAPVVDVVDEIEPVRFWPHLKQFKNEQYVIRRPLADGVEIAFDPKIFYLPICTRRFEEVCLDQKLRLSFSQLPVYLD